MAVNSRVGNLDRAEGMSQFHDIWALSREGWRLAPSGGLLPRWFLSWMAASGQLNCSSWARSSQSERFKQHRRSRSTFTTLHQKAQASPPVYSFLFVCFKASLYLKML